MNAKQKIELCTIRELFEDTEKKLYVPNYLYTYAWDTRNIKQWIFELEEVSQYYLGHIILEKTDYGYAVIDGQQRLATFLIFLSTADESIFEPYFDHFSLGDADNDFFQNIIRNGQERQAQTLAQEYIQEVHKYAIGAKKYLRDYTCIKMYDLYRKLLDSVIFVSTIDDTQNTAFRSQLRNDWFWKPIDDKEKVPKVKKYKNIGSKFKIESCTIQELFENKEIKRFIVNEPFPYAWRGDSEKEFLNDILKNSKRQYYLGCILLEEIDGVYTIIQGQQYLITILIFLSVADNEQFHHYFDKFLLDDANNDFFQTSIKNGQEIQAKTDVQKQIKRTQEYSQNKIKTKLWQTLAEKLLKANIAVITAKDKASISLFRLGDYRGESLSIVEKLKAYLVHQIQSCAGDPEEKLAELAACFDKISLLSCQLFKKPAIIIPEKILFAHYQAFMSHNDNIYSRFPTYYTFSSAMEAYFQEYKNKNKRVDVIIEFCKELTSSFENIRKLENTKMKEYQDTFRYLDMPDYALPFILCEMKKRSTKDLKTLLKVLAELVLRHETVDFHRYGENRENDSCDIDITSYHRLGWLLEKYRKERDPDLLSTRLYQGFEGQYKEIEYNWNFKNSTKDIALPWSAESYIKYKSRGEYLLWLNPFFLYQYELYLKKGIVDWDEESVYKHEIFTHSHEAVRLASFVSSVKINKSLRSKYYSIGSQVLLEESLFYRAAKQPFAKRLDIYKESKLAQANEIERFATKGREDIEAWALDIVENREKHLIEFIQNSYTPDKNSKRLGMF